MNMDKRYIITATLIYLVLSCTTLANWHLNSRFDVNGDEPHYLIMASGISQFRTLEQTKPYEAEFKSRAIYKPGFAPKNATPDPTNTHAIIGPHGLFGVHNIGLPILLAIPYTIGGMLGAKIFMVLLSSLIPVVAWRISSLFTANLNIRFIATSLLAMGLPLIPASNQIYPDLLAGLICLNGVYWFLTAKSQRSASVEIFFTICLSFLPWLQIKFFAVSSLLIFSIMIRLYMYSKNALHLVRIFIIFVTFSVILASYNFYAFGKISGPYQTGVLEFSKTAMMVLIGLGLDQNQGFFLQNSIFFVGLPAIGTLFKYDWKAGLVWLLTFAALILPNAMYPNWYGGSSFSGRFGWPAAIVFMLPTVMGICWLATFDKLLFCVAAITTTLLQLTLYFKYTFLFGDLYNRSALNWIESYTEFYSPLQQWFPALYNIEWAANYYPNYAFLLFAAGLTIIGIIKAINQNIIKPFFLRSFMTINCIAIVLCGLIPEPFNRPSFPLQLLAANMPSQAGKVEGTARVADPNSDKAGFIIFGPPAFILHRGHYQATFDYVGEGLTDQPIGRWEIIQLDEGIVMQSGELFGTTPSSKPITTTFEVLSRLGRRYDFRVFWNGTGTFKMLDVRLEQLK